MPVANVPVANVPVANVPVANVPVANKRNQAGFWGLPRLSEFVECGRPLLVEASKFLTLPCPRYRPLFLAMANTCAHTAFLATNLPSTLARLLHSHEILSSIRLGLYEIATFSAFAFVCEAIGYHRTPSLINTCIGAMFLERLKT